MKAVIITRPGPPEVLKIDERPVPKPKTGEVLIQVKAAGVNRPDCYQRAGKYPAPPGAPQDIPGLEVAGLIVETGGDTNGVKTGDGVCALLAGGGYAEYAIAHSSLCLPIPQGMDFISASSLPETIFTVWYNVFVLGRLKKNEIFLIHGGSSGIGITAIQLAHAFGARVFVTAGTKEKCEACISLGAEKCINYRMEDFEEQLKEEGADLVLDMVGGDYIKKNLRLLRPDGRLVFINAMKGGKAEFDVWELMKKRLTITGSTLRGRDLGFKGDLAGAVKENVWPLLESGKFKPVIGRVFDYREAASAHELMENSEHIGKLVLRFD